MNGLHELSTLSNRISDELIKALSIEPGEYANGYSAGLLKSHNLLTELVRGIQYPSIKRVRP